MAKTSINYSVIAGIAMLLLGVGVTQVYNSFQPETYYCETSKIVMACDSLSAYYSLPNGKCNNAQVGNKLCRTGWLKIENDQVIEVPDPVSYSGKWRCDTEKCLPI